MVAAIPSLGIIGNFDMDWNSPMAQATRDAAATLSRRLGYGTVDDGAADRQSAEHAGQPGTADGACA